MNLSRPPLAVLSYVFRFWLSLRRLLPRQKSRTFGVPDAEGCRRIEKVCVINLDRQPGRWAKMEQELRHILDSSGTELLNLTERHVAVDANTFTQDPPKDADIDEVLHTWRATLRRTPTVGLPHTVRTQCSDPNDST